MNTQTHRDIVQESMKDAGLASDDLERMVRACVDVDLDQLHAEKHFDNCPDLPTLKRRWEKGLNAYRKSASTAAAVKDWRRFFIWMGRAAHCVADFYAHSNWVELHEGLSAADLPCAPLLGDSLPVQTLPPTLQTGFYSLRYGMKGCPKRDGEWRPPELYRYCHEQLAKDHLERGHGADAFPGGGTYYEAACLLAVRSTRELWVLDGGVFKLR